MFVYYMKSLNDNRAGHLDGILSVFGVTSIYGDGQVSNIAYGYIASEYRN